MIHILLNKNKEFYWLSVTKKAGTFEVIAGSKNYHSQKHNCEKSIKAEAMLFAGQGCYVIDHTLTKIKAFGLERFKVDKWLKHSWQPNKHHQSEIEFVQKLKK